MSILDALKKLVVKRGGTPKGSNIAEVIDDLAETSSGGGERFEVACTPTSQDFSGTMDKTVAEIMEAYNAGCDIWFALTTSEGTQKVRLSDVGFANNVAYPSFNTVFVYADLNLLMKFHSGATDQGDNNMYGTTIYSLTPYAPNNA